MCVRACVRACVRVWVRCFKPGTDTIVKELDSDTLMDAVAGVTCVWQWRTAFDTEKYEILVSKVMLLPNWREDWAIDYTHVCAHPQRTHA